MTCFSMSIHTAAIRLVAGLALAASAAAPAVQAATFSWTAASGLRPDQTGGFSLLAQGAAQATLAPGGPLQLATTGTGPDALAYRASGGQIQLRDDLVVEFSTRFVGSTEPIAGSLSSPLMVSVSFGDHVGANLMITERAASFTNVPFMPNAPGAQLDWFSMNTHRLAFSGSTTAGSVAHFINGEFRYRMPLQRITAQLDAVPAIRFGDFSTEFDGQSAWLAFSHNAAPVPEPAGPTLWLAGLAGLGCWWRLAAGRQRAAATACPSSITASA